MRECVWNGDPVKVPQGELQGIVCRTEGGQYIAGAQVYSHDQEKNWTAGPDTRFLRRAYASEPMAITASERFVSKIAPRLNKHAPSSARQRTLASLERAATPRPDSEKRPPPRSKSHSIDR
jgi:hypothetical protein